MSEGRRHHIYTFILCSEIQSKLVKRPNPELSGFSQLVFSFPFYLHISIKIAYCLKSRWSGKHLIFSKYCLKEVDETDSNKPLEALWEFICSQPLQNKPVVCLVHYSVTSKENTLLFCNRSSKTFVSSSSISGRTALTNLQ